MKRRRSRWALIATVAIALGTALMSPSSLTPLAFSGAAPYTTAPGAGAPPANVSWQVTLMGGRW
ncbi:hypothetical protein [Simplicispira psychrophila]|uniref:hypothetical protein n=1 Tax=Simplicispira psychrophila TaxID=80882 RepID=UPI00048A371B|nr:hypothetical protein [Simplicispira psychrophila]